MPPRVGKKPTTTPDAKKPLKDVKKAQSQPESTPTASETVKTLKPETQFGSSAKKKAMNEDNRQDETHTDLKSENNGGLSSKKDEKQTDDKEEEYEKGEQLEFEDNDAEFEPEEEIDADYDDKDMDHEIAEEEFDEEPEVGEGDEEVFDDVDPTNVANSPQDGTDVRDRDIDQEQQDVVKERRKRKEYEVFVGGLDKDATEDDLKKVFSEVGEVVEIRLMRNPQTNKNKGFAFLRFQTVEQAQRAVTELKNPVVNGKKCGVSPSEDSDTLFLGNISKTWTKEALKDKLKYYGVDNVEEITLVEDVNSKGTNRGFAFLEFSSRTDALKASKLLQRRDVMFGVERPAKVSFADSFIDPGDEVMSHVRKVFVDGISSSWDEDHVRGLLQKYGSIEKIELSRNMPAAKRRDFGFITFASHDSAVTCAKVINNTDLGEGDDKSKVRARLSRPLLREQGHDDFIGVRESVKASRESWFHPYQRDTASRPERGPRARRFAESDRVVKKPRDRYPPPIRGRPPSTVKSYERRPPVGLRDYGRREELPPRGRIAAGGGYGSREIPERALSYRDEFRGAPRFIGRREYDDDAYAPPQYDRPSLGYRETRPRDYDTLSGSKRGYTEVDDVHSRYVDVGPRQGRPRLDYEVGARASHYKDPYSASQGRTGGGVAYAGRRSAISTHESSGLYASRHDIGGYGGDESGGVYGTGLSRDYGARGADVGSSYSYYSGRSLGGGAASSYPDTGGSSSYY